MNIFSILAVSLLSIQLAPISLQQHSFQQSVRVNDVFATVTVRPISSKDYKIDVAFRTSEHSSYPAGCLSAYRDFHYTLRDANARVIAASNTILEQPPFEGKSVSGLSAKRDGKEDCALNGLHTFGGFALLSKIYPDLPTGKYTLKITFAPRHLTQHVDISPIPILIE